MLNGLARLVSAYGDSLKEDMFKDQLSRFSIKKLVRVTNKRRAGSLGFAEVMPIYYHKKFMRLRWSGIFSIQLRWEKSGLIRRDTGRLCEMEEEPEMDAGEQINMFADEDI